MALGRVLGALGWRKVGTAMAAIEETKRMGGWGQGIRERVGQWGWKVGGVGRSWGIALGLVLWLSLGGCGGGAATVVPKPLLSPEAGMADRNLLTGEIAEVSPPGGIQQLKSFLDAYSPQVRIVAPRNGEVLTQTAVTARVRLQGLPIYRDEAGRLGPHLRVFLDDRPPILLASLTDGQGQLELGDLAPGSHTLRVMATRPWGESFKNEGALAQVSFQVFTASEAAVTPGIPQLIYNSPQGIVGAQPVLLDFWLRDIPLHEVAQGEGAIADWRLRCTLNGQTFVFDRWQPIYLTGFKPGQNWIKLELIDSMGAVFPNPFNSVLRVVDYQPQGEDPWAALFTGIGDWSAWRQLVDPSYVPPTLGEPEGIGDGETDTTLEADPGLESGADPGPEPDETQGETPGLPEATVELGAEGGPAAAIAPLDLEEIESPSLEVSEPIRQEGDSDGTPDPTPPPALPVADLVSPEAMDGAADPAKTLEPSGDTPAPSPEVDLILEVSPAEPSAATEPSDLDKASPTTPEIPPGPVSISPEDIPEATPEATPEDTPQAVP